MVEAAVVVEGEEGVATMPSNNEIQMSMVLLRVRQEESHRHGSHNIIISVERTNQLL